MRTHLPLLLLFVLLAGCKSKDKPAIEPERMEKILTDLHIAEAYSTMVNDSLHHVRNKNFDSLAVYYNDIFAHHNVSKEEFMQSVTWYKLHPDDLDTIYAHVQVATGLLELKGGK